MEESNDEEKLDVALYKHCNKWRSQQFFKALAKYQF
jgi:hypothetical protein